jgi:hypothetical protein
MIMKLVKGITIGFVCGFGLGLLIMAIIVVAQMGLAVSLGV